MDSLISVIIPVYNVAQYLPRCLNSIINQTYSNLEIILVNDGSQDDSGIICDKYAAEDMRIKVIHQANAGLGPARNSGFKICTGEYVVYVDSDDFIPLDSIDKLYRRICNDNSDMVIGNCVKIYENNYTSPLCYKFNNAILTPQELFNRFAVYSSIPVSAWAKLYKKEVLKNIEFPYVRIGEDMLVFPDIVDNCTHISLEESSVYYYFQRDTSLMREKTEQAKKDRLYAILRTTSYLLERECLPAAITWYSFAVKIALSIKRKTDRLSEFYHLFDQKSRRWLWSHMDIKGKIVWCCLFVPLIYYIQRPLFPSLNRG